MLVRCEHATALAKSGGDRAVIGDYVDVDLVEGHDKGLIRAVLPRTTAFVRRDPAERTAAQVLAANFTMVVIAEPLAQLNLNRLVRELVLAHETGAAVVVALTKADLAAAPQQVEAACAQVREVAGPAVRVLAVSAEDATSIEAMRTVIAPGTMAVLVGKSGVGKSSLVNLLLGAEVRQTQEVRSRDGKGRHTTVSRALLDVPGGGSVVDMPGVRGLGLWEAEHGIAAAFADIEDAAARCQFRDCQHRDEPGCAVLAAVEAGEIAVARLRTYQELCDELAQLRDRQEEARHLRGEKASDRKAGRSAGRAAGRASGRAADHRKRRR